jgi:hypothetical protein
MRCYFPQTVCDTFEPVSVMHLPLANLTILHCVSFFKPLNKR